jgi:GTPase SAR1 family protein
MTEGQDAATAPVPWIGASRSLPAAADRDRAGAGVAGPGFPGPGVAGDGTGYAQPPAPAAVAVGLPGPAPDSPKHGGTGWPEPEPAQPVTEPSGTASGASQPRTARPGRHEPRGAQPGAPGWPETNSAGRAPASASQRRSPRHGSARPAETGADRSRTVVERSVPVPAPTAPAPTVAEPTARDRADARPAELVAAETSPAETRPAAAGPAVADTAASGAGRAKPVSGGIWSARTERADAGSYGSAQSGGSRSAGLGAADSADGDEPFARVDARKLEAALLGLRHPIVTVPLLFDAPGVAEARAERLKLLSQIDDYLLPRLRQSGAPILVALVGSTGAGKSTLMNSLVGKQVSATGIRRPTTNSPVLACHPDDIRWFAENVFLPTLPRVRQQGLAMPGRDGLLVLAASEGMPRGVALLDTPDIDSVVQAHHDFAHQFLDASDLWFFVTTARRYADAAVWEMLKDARDRGAAMALALSRVPSASSSELSAHFDAMLEANGLGEVRRFIIPETTITEDRLPSGVTAPVRDWLTDTARREDRRVAVLTQTMSGVLDTFRSRVPALADQVAEQLVLRRVLRDSIDTAYSVSLAEFDEATRDGSLLRGEVLARWQDFAGTGDLLRTLQARRGRGIGKQKKQRMPARATALKDALQTSMESLVTATADRAAELVVAEWQHQSAGSSLLAGLDNVSNRRGGANETDFVAAALADLGLATRGGPAAAGADTASLARATAGLAALAQQAVRTWQEHVLRLVKEENVTKRSIARVVSFDDESLALVLSIGILSYAAPDAAPHQGESAVPQRLLTSLFGAGLLRDMGTRVRQDLRDRVSALFEAEARRYFAIVDAAGVPDETAAADLLQAGYGLEAAR